MSRKSTERLSQIRQSLSLAFAALVTGSRTIPLGDNGALLRELALRVATPSLPLQCTRSGTQPQVPTV